MVHSTRQLTQMALLIALAVVGRLGMQWLPNVQPVTALLLLIAVYGNVRVGLAVAVGTMLLSNIFLGMGPWTGHQILSYSVIILITAGLRHKLPLAATHSWRSVIGLFWAFLAGMIYGILISLCAVWQYRLPHFWPYYLNGVSFDLMHACGNVLFYGLLRPVLGPILQRELLS